MNAYPTLTTLKIGPAPHIAVDVQGEGPLVVLLHGIGGNRTNWRDQLPALAGDFTAAAWDARGYGDSDDYDTPLDFGDFGRDLLRVLDHFEAETAHIVGLSMGGRIAADFYGRYPARVATLTLADTSFGGPPPTPERIREVLDLRQRPLLEGKTPAEIAPAVAKSLAGPSTTAASMERLIASLAALHTQSYLKTLEAVTIYHHFPASESFNVPCLIIVGEEDGVAKPEVMQSLANGIPGAEFVMIEKAAHISNIEQPEAFNHALLGFLRKHKAAAYYKGGTHER